MRSIELSALLNNFQINWILIPNSLDYYFVRNSEDSKFAADRPANPTVPGFSVLPATSFSAAPEAPPSSSHASRGPALPAPEIRTCRSCSRPFPPKSSAGTELSTNRKSVRSAKLPPLPPSKPLPYKSIASPLIQSLGMDIRFIVSRAPDH